MSQADKFYRFKLQSAAAENNPTDLISKKKLTDNYYVN